MIHLKRFTALLAFLVAVPSLAGVTVDQSQVLDRWAVHIGGYVTSLGTDIRLDGPNGTGTTISLEDDLGFSSSESVPQFTAGVILGQRHQISLSYFKTDRTSSTTITKEIEWGDEVFPINIDVSAFLDTEFLTLGYTYWFYSSEKTAIGISGGLTQFNLRSGIEIGGRDAPIGVATDIDTDVPVPQLGASINYALPARFVLIGKLGYISFTDVGGFSGDISSAIAGIQYRPWKHIGFGVNYNWILYDIDSEETGFAGAFEYTIQGFDFYLRLAF